MKVGPDQAFHLTYCSNIHPGESWNEVRDSLDVHVPPLKRALSPDGSFGLGLRLSNRAADALLTEDHLSVFRDWLDANDLYVFTLNGFPYGSFHRSIVKDSVYRPDWRTSERVAYTVKLSTILDRLLPEGMEGGISTSPLSYKPWLHNEAAYDEAFEQSTRHLVDVVEHLVNLRHASGRLIHVDIEPEPDCLIENIPETVSYFTRWLFPKGSRQLAGRLGVSAGAAEALLRDHVRLCYDTCHFAVEYERAGEVWSAMKAAGIQVGKVQISAAVKVTLPADPEARKAVASRLEPFAESTYLHQVVERRSDGSRVQYNDLPEALPHIFDSAAEEWRIHFHVPIFVDDYEGIRSTRSDIAEALSVLIDEPACTHLEIETYTWEVLPEGLKQDLTVSIQREYEWVLDQLGR